MRYIEATPIIGNDGKYHFCYAVINSVNNKVYLGKHSTKNINDDYRGSGVPIKRAHKKYGIKNFTIIKLAYFETSSLAFEMESLIVDKNIVKNKMFYNVKLGGDGGFDHINDCPEKKKEAVNKTKDSFSKKSKEELEEINSKKSRPGDKNYWFGKDRSGENNPRFGIKMEEETKRKISDKRKKYYETHDSHWKGKTLSEEEKLKIADRNSKEYTFINPEGNSVTFKNLAKFCKDNQLSLGCMSHVVNGRNKSHKGWKYNG